MTSNLTISDASIDRILELDKVKNFVFNHPQVLIGTIGYDGLFVHVNKSWEDILGFPESFIKSESFFDLLHPDDLELSSEIYKFFIENKKPGMSMFTNRYRKHDGSYVTIQWLSPFKIPIGDLWVMTAVPLPDGVKGVNVYDNGFNPKSK